MKELHKIKKFSETEGFIAGVDNTGLSSRVKPCTSFNRTRKRFKKKSNKDTSSNREIILLETGNNKLLGTGIPIIESEVATRDVCTLYAVD